MEQKRIMHNHPINIPIGGRGEKHKHWMDHNSQLT